MLITLKIAILAHGSAWQRTTVTKIYKYPLHAYSKPLIIFCGDRSQSSIMVLVQHFRPTVDAKTGRTCRTHA
jgi:hypothetical protein